MKPLVSKRRFWSPLFAYERPAGRDYSEVKALYASGKGLHSPLSPHEDKDSLDSGRLKLWIRTLTPIERLLLNRIIPGSGVVMSR